LSAFSGDTSKQNKQWNNSVSQNLATAKGYPIFHYIYEINSVAIQPVHDSIFEIPKGYQLVTNE